MIPELQLSDWDYTTVWLIQKSMTRPGMHCNMCATAPFMRYALRVRISATMKIGERTRILPSSLAASGMSGAQFVRLFMNRKLCQTKKNTSSPPPKKYVHAGLSNQLMELEIKVGLAYLSSRTLVTRGRLRLRAEGDSGQQQNAQSAKLLDLFDVPVKHATAAQLKGERFQPYIQLPWDGDCSSKAFFCYPNADAFPSFLVASFRNNRQYCWQLSRRQ